MVLQCGQRQLLWENCGDSTGAVLEHDVRGLRVLSRCASDAPTQSFSRQLSPVDDDDEGLGDDDDLLEFRAADEESKMEEV